MTDNMKNKIQILLTGGTIDSHWEGKVDTTVVNEQSDLPKYFEQLILYVDMEFKEICMKDSRKLTEEDIDNLLAAIEQSPYSKIIITHGTYTMPDTGRILKANLKRKDQTVVLTGAMAPLRGFDGSDAAFNLGYAIAKVQQLEPGVYISMNGRTFTPEEVAKSLSEGKYYSIFKQEQ